MSVPLDGAGFRGQAAQSKRRPDEAPSPSRTRSTTSTPPASPPWARDTISKRPAILEAKGVGLGVAGLSDHPAEWEARTHRPGVAFDPLGRSSCPGRPGLPAWLTETIATLGADALLVTPHWGPNMTTGPELRTREAATELLEAGATLVQAARRTSSMASREPCSTTSATSWTTARAIRGSGTTSGCSSS